MPRGRFEVISRSTEPTVTAPVIGPWGGRLAVSIDRARPPRGCRIAQNSYPTHSDPARYAVIQATSVHQPSSARV